MSSKAPLNASSQSLYPSINMEDLVQNLFPDHQNSPSAPPLATEQLLITVPGAIVHLIDKLYSVELACGDLTVVKLSQGDNTVVVLVRVGGEIQWPLAKDEAVVKIDNAHYFFSIRDGDEEDNEDLLNYGLTIASKGQESLVLELERVLRECSGFSEHKVSEVLDGNVANEISPLELVVGEKKEIMEKSCAAYWTTLAPNVEDYSTSAARLIASGSGHLIKGILWCGDVTVERLKWGNEVVKKRMSPGANKEISPDTLKRIKRCVDD